MVHFELCFAWTSQSHATTTLTLQVGPESCESRKHILVLCQLHLCLGSRCLGTHGKNIQNQTRSVQYLDLQFFFNVSDLLGCQFVVKNHHTHLVGQMLFARVGDARFEIHLQSLFASILLLLDELLDFIQFATADVGYAAGAIYTLRIALDDLCSCCLGQKLQFIEVFVCLSLILLRCYQTNNYRRFHLYLSNHKFFHSVSLIHNFI